MEHSEMTVEKQTIIPDENPYQSPMVGGLEAMAQPIEEHYPSLQRPSRGRGNPDGVRAIDV